MTSACPTARRFLVAVTGAEVFSSPASEVVVEAGATATVAVDCESVPAGGDAHALGKLLLDVDDPSLPTTYKIEVPLDGVPNGPNDA